MSQSDYPILRAEIAIYIYVCIYIWHVHILDFSFYIGSTYNIIATKIYKLQENKEENSNTRQDKGIRGKELLKIYLQLSKTTIYRHAMKPVAGKT